MRITKLTRHEAGYWSANVSVDGETIAVDDRFGSWQTRPDAEGATKGVLSWAAAELQERVTAVRLEQTTDKKEREVLNALRKAALAAQRTIQRPARAPKLPERPALKAVPDPEAEIIPINAKALAQKMAAAGRAAATSNHGGDAA